jgi:drug/metabolite transporter (DMT)-like permease
VSPRALTNLVLVLAVGLGWGLLGPASKALFAADPAFDGFTLATARAAWCFPIFLIGLGAAWRIDPPRLDAGRWLAIVAAGLMFGLVITVVFSVAAQHTSVSHISFLIGMSPVTNTAAAALVFRTKLHRRDWIALVLGVLGVALLATAHSNDKAAIFGDSLMVVWLIAFAAYACILRYVGARVPPAFTMSAVGAISMGVLLVVGLALGWGGAIGHVIGTPQIGWWFFGEVALGSTLIAQTAYTAAVRRMGVAVATIGAEYTALAVGVAMSLAMHESWTPLTAISGLIFCCALAVTFAPLPWLASPKPRTA